MPKPEIAVNLIEYIEGQIMTGRYPVGSKLPSLRSLARRFKISYSSAWNGVEYLVLAGKLHKSPRRGIFVQARTPVTGDATRQLALIAPHFTSLTTENAGLFHSALSRIEELAREHGYALLVIPMPNLKQMAPDTVEKLNCHCCGVILMKEIDEWLIEMPLEVPTVGVLMEKDYGGNISIVGIDPHHAARAAVGFFLRNNISKVEIVCSDYPCYRLRANLFELYYREAGGTVSGWIMRQPERGGTIEHFHDDRGYFFSSDGLLYGIMSKHLELFGKLPLDPGRMIAVDGKNMLMPWEFHFPTIAADWRLIGELAFRECLSLIADPGQPRRRIYLAGKLVEPPPSNFTSIK